MNPEARHFLFKSLGLEFVVLSVWGDLSDERLGLVFCKLQSGHLSVCTFTIYIFVSNTRSFSPGSVEQIMPYYSLVAHATTAV
jgi:hypothetical protein